MQLLLRIPAFLPFTPILRHLTRMVIPMWVAANLMVAQLGTRYLEMDRRTLEAENAISYEETLEYVENPGMGFYFPGQTGKWLF